MKNIFQSMQKNEDGVVAIMFAMILPVLLLFLAISIDVSRTFATRAKLVSAQDAAALAAAATPPERLYHFFTACATCPSGGQVNSLYSQSRAGYAEKYLAFNLGDSYLGTETKDKVTFANTGRSVLADSTEVKVKPFFLPDTELTGGTGAEVQVGQESTTGSALIGFVIDISHSMESGIGDGSGTQKIEAVQKGMEQFLSVLSGGDGTRLTKPEAATLAEPAYLAVDTPGATSPSLLPGLEIGFALFHRDSGFRNFGADREIRWWPYKVGSPSFGRGYDDTGHDLQEHDLAPLSSDYTKVYNFIVGIGSNYNETVINDSYSSLRRKVVSSAIANAKGTCISCGLFEISNFFTAKDGNISPAGNPYGRPCKADGTATNSDGRSAGACPSNTAKRTIVIITDGFAINYEPHGYAAPDGNCSGDIDPRYYNCANTDASPIQDPNQGISQITNPDGSYKEIKYWKYDPAIYPDLNLSRSDNLLVGLGENAANADIAYLDDQAEIAYNMSITYNRTRGMMKKLYGEDVYRFGRYVQYTPMLNHGTDSGVRDDGIALVERGNRLQGYYGNDKNASETSVFREIGFEKLSGAGNWEQRRGMVNLHENCKVLREAGYKIVTILIGKPANNVDGRNAVRSLKECSTGYIDKETTTVWDPVLGKSVDETVFFNAITKKQIEETLKNLAGTATATTLRVNK